MKTCTASLVLIFVTAHLIGCGGANTDKPRVTEQDEFAAYVAEHGDDSAPEAEDND